MRCRGVEESEERGREDEAFEWGEVDEGLVIQESREREGGEDRVGACRSIGPLQDGLSELFRLTRIAGHALNLVGEETDDEGGGWSGLRRGRGSGCGEGGWREEGSGGQDQPTNVVDLRFGTMQFNELSPCTLASALQMGDGRLHASRGSPRYDRERRWKTRTDLISSRFLIQLSSVSVLMRNPI